MNKEIRISMIILYVHIDFNKISSDLFSSYFSETFVVK